MGLEPPPHIVVGGRTIPVLVAPLDEEEALGLYNSTLRTITVDSSTLLDKRLLRDTLVHEVIHCALDLAGVSFTSSGTLGSRVEEQVVTAVEALAAPAIASIWNL